MIPDSYLCRDLFPLATSQIINNATGIVIRALSLVVPLAIIYNIVISVSSDTLIHVSGKSYKNKEMVNRQLKIGKRRGPKIVIPMQLIPQETWRKKNNSKSIQYVTIT